VAYPERSWFPPAVVHRRAVLAMKGQVTCSMVKNRVSVTALRKPGFDGETETVRFQAVFSWVKPIPEWVKEGGI
jgi:hypothetical protein